MLFNPALVLSFLVAPAVLADNSHKNHGSHLLNPVEQSANLTKRDIQYIPNWAGASLTKGRGTFRHVEGIFVIPDISGEKGTSGSAWVGIDANSCPDAILGTGFNFAPGEPLHAWYQWNPGPVLVYPGVTIKTGDKLKVSVTAYSPTRGRVKIVNLSNGQYAEEHVSAPSAASALCMQGADWVVEDFSRGARAPDFGTITFTDAKAFDHKGKSYEPADGTIFYMERDGKLLATASASENTVIVHRV